MKRLKQTVNGGFVRNVISPKIDNSTKQLKVIFKWLFGKGTQKDMPGEDRTFRRNTAQLWNIWTLPPVVEAKREVLYFDGIYLCRHAFIMICCNSKHIFGWNLCRYEHSIAWSALLSRFLLKRGKCNVVQSAN